VEPVAMMPGTLIQSYFPGSERLLLNGRVADRETAPIHLDPSVCPLEMNASARAGRMQHNAIGVGVFHLKANGRVVEALAREFRKDWLRAHRSRIIRVVPPLGNILTMCSPVSHLAAGIFIKPPEGSMPPLWGKFRPWRRARPE